MALVLDGDTQLGEFGPDDRVPVSLSLRNDGWTSLDVPARIVLDDLFFDSTTRDGVDFALVTGPPGLPPPGGREWSKLGAGETKPVRIEDFCFRWQSRTPGLYRFGLRVRAGRKLSNVHVVEFRLL
jgi:hypothetical protein